MAKPACWLSLSMFAAACMSVVAGLGVITATGKIEVCSGQKNSLVGETHVVRPGNVAFDCHRLSFRHASCMMQQWLRGMGTCRPPYTKSFATFTAKVLIVQSLWLRCSNISRSDPLITHRQKPLISSQPWVKARSPTSIVRTSGPQSTKKQETKRCVRGPICIELDSVRTLTTPLYRSSWTSPQLGVDPAE